MIGNIYRAKDLNEVISALNDIASRCNIKAGQPLWYRGHNQFHYQLIPSIMRDQKKESINEKGTYSSLNLREEYRLQNYKARVFHLTKPMPGNSIEWTALYQHHFGKTRFLDWSESVWTALDFSLEVYMDPRERLDLDALRSGATPVVWVLNPVVLNQHVYDFFIKHGEEGGYFRKAVGEYQDAGEDLEKVLTSMSGIEDSPYHIAWGEGDNDVADLGIINLGVLDECRRRRSSDIPGLLRTGEYNPFFFMCVRYYADALPVIVTKVERDVLPPLAVLHQYQNERIRSQRGTFTVFPNYFLKKEAEECRALHFDMRAMENQDFINDCLFEIRILDPRKVAKELMRTGSRQTEIYPESDSFARGIEARNFLI